MTVTRWFALVLLVFVIAYLGAISPQRNILKKEQTKESALKDALEFKQRKFVNLDPLKLQLKELLQRLDEMHTMLPDEFDEAEARQVFEDAATKSGIEVQQLDFDQSRYREFYYEVPFELTVNGDFHKVYRFFHDTIQASGRAIAIESADIRSFGKGENIQVALLGRSYFYLDEEDGS